MSNLGLAGKERAMMINFIRRPLRVWLGTHAKKCFPDPKATEAQDIVAEATLLALSDLLDEQALVQVALDILEKRKK